jgi:CRP-like cAMP-binding protein
MRAGPFTHDLLSILGEDAFLRLAEEFGGTELYVPGQLPDDHPIVAAIGSTLAQRLASFYAPTAIRVPLARRERAIRLRSQGLTQREIARKLGMTESGVYKLLNREQALPESARSVINSAQLPLFGD